MMHNVKIILGFQDRVLSDFWPFLYLKDYLLNGRGIVC